MKIFFKMKDKQKQKRFQIQSVNSLFIICFNNKHNNNRNVYLFKLHIIYTELKCKLITIKEKKEANFFKNEINKNNKYYDKEIKFNHKHLVL